MSCSAASSPSPTSTAPSSDWRPAFRITGAGNDTWQGTDQYSALYQPAGGDDRYDAVVRVDAHTMTHGSAKAGLIVRNDMTQPGVSPGYAMVALRPAGGMEFLTDSDGNGTLNTSVGGGTSGTPKWLKLSRRGDSYSGYWSNNGTSWTQIGTTLTLANAGATQDVGMVEMSHEAAAKSADFSQFAIDTDPTDAAARAAERPADVRDRAGERRVRLAVTAPQVDAAQRPGQADHPDGRRAEPAGHHR